MNELAISLCGLTKHFDNKIVLQGIECTFEKNKIYALIGRNGVGKSTLLKLIAGKIQPDAGEISIHNQQRLGYLGPDTEYPDFIRLDAISQLFEVSHKHWQEERFISVLNIFELDISAKYGNLSTGEKSGVKLAVLLAQKADIWLIDEATLGIDIVAQAHCLTALIDFFAEDEPCVVFCSHQVNEIERLADEVLVMNDAAIQWQGEVDELAEQKNLSEAVFTLFNAPKNEEVS